MKEFDGWPIYKIKLGTADDLAIVRELRRHTDAIFRIDANTAWTAEQTHRVCARVEATRRRVHRAAAASADDWDGMRRVFARMRAAGHRRRKLPRRGGRRHAAPAIFTASTSSSSNAGGLTPARRMIARARELGLKVMVGCMTESTRRHLRHRPVAAAARLRRHGRRRAHRARHRHRRATRDGARRFSYREWERCAPGPKPRA